MKTLISIFLSLLCFHNLFGQWELLNSPINDSWVTHLAINEDHIWAATAWDGVWKQNKTSGQWEEITSLPDSVFTIDLITQSDIVYGLFIQNEQYRIYTSTDLGISWNNITPQNVNAEFSEFYVDGPSVFIGGNIDLNFSKLYVSTDTGDIWEPFTFKIGIETIWPSMFARKSNIIFTATPEKIYRSFDNGGTWEELLNSPVFEAGCPLCEIVQLSTTDSMVLALEMNDYYHSTRLHISFDNGDNWEIVDFGYPSSGFFGGFTSYNPIDDIILAIDFFQNEGIYTSFDGGHTSILFNEGLNTLNVRDLVFEGEYIYAGTGGEGVWRRKIQDLYTTSTQTVTQPNEIQIFPNPSNGNFTLKLDSQFSGKADIVISDLNGKVCLTKQIVLEAQTEFGTETLASGLYFLTVQSGDKIYSGKMVIQR